MGKKLALIIGNSVYKDSTLRRLKAPESDVGALAEVLKNPEVGAFDDAKILMNVSSTTVRQEINEFFTKKTHDDLLLLYFSGHGVLDERGHLYLAVKDTKRDLLHGTAIPASYIKEEMDYCHSKSQVLVLDCCHSGAFERGTKGAIGTSVGTGAIFEGAGHGRVVLTATDATQYAWEGDQINGEDESSLFTRYLVEGLQTGQADLNGDGQITINELFNYVRDQVVKSTSKQTPLKWSSKEEGDIVIANTPQKEASAPEENTPPPDETKPKHPLRWKWILAGLLILVLLGGGGLAITYFTRQPTATPTERAVTVLLTNTPSPNVTPLFPTPKETFLPPKATNTTGVATGTSAPIETPIIPTTFSSLPVLARTPVPIPAATISPENASQVTQLARWRNGNLQGSTAVNNLAYSPDGQTLASGSNDSTIRLLRNSDGSLLRTLEGHQSSVTSVAFSPDGQTLASGSWDKTIRLWHTSDGSPLRTLTGHANSVTSVAFSPDGQTLASGSADTTIRLWRTADGSLLHTLEGHMDQVSSVAFSPDGQTLASGSRDKTILLWRVSDGSLLRTLEGHKSWVNSVAFSPDGQTLASGSIDSPIRLWRVSDGSPLRNLEGSNGGVYSVAFSPDGQTLASGSGDNAIRLWRVSDGSLLRTLQGHTNMVNNVVFSPDGRILASSGSNDYTIRLWGVP